MGNNGGAGQKVLQPQEEEDQKSGREAKGVWQTGRLSSDWAGAGKKQEEGTAIMVMKTGGVTFSCAAKSKCPRSQDCNSVAAGWRGCKDDGKCVGSPKLRLLRRCLLTVASGTGGTPICDSWRASPSEINGQKSQD